jgi:antitoxin component YwqK of YwqJK toxin-antitoxin module
MRIPFFILAAGCAAICGCQKSNNENNVVSQRYVHKYGYAVSKEEWEARNYPGQVITTQRDGVTVTMTYENGELQGPCTYTYPHSQTVEKYILYNQGNKVKEITYNIHGMPVKEIVTMSPTRYSITLWYADGTPLSIEEYANTELLEGQYFTMNNEIEARVEKGVGTRIRRDEHGVLLAREQFEAGSVVKQETFYPNGTPESISTYAKNKLHGEKRTFNEKGEPLTSEEWINGKLHGKTTHFKNGVPAMEISYLFGQKDGSEVHYSDGETVVLEVQWENGKKHGPTTYFLEGGPKIEWYYDGELVSQATYDDLYRRDQMISKISPELKVLLPH